MGAVDQERSREVAAQQADLGQLRDNRTSYDAAYVALAELTGAVLVTGGEHITATPGGRCDIQITR